MRIVLALAVLFPVFSGMADTIDFADRAMRYSLFKGGERLQKTEVTGDGLRMNWDFAKARWIEVHLNPHIPLPEFTTGDVTLEFDLPEQGKLRQISIRLVDSTGETFQYSQPAGQLKPGRQQLRFPIDTAKKVQSWGGKAPNGALDFPVKIGGLSIDFTATEGAGSILLREAMFSRELPKGVRQAESVFRFDDADQWKCVFYEGDGQNKTAAGTTAVTLNCKAAAYYIVPKAQVAMRRPTMLTFHADLQAGEGEMRFVLADAKGKEYKAEWKALVPGKNELKFSLAAAGNLTTPLRLTVVSLRSPNNSAVMNMEKIVLSGESTEIDALLFDTEAAWPINIEDPESGKQVALTLSNPVNFSCSVDLKLELRDAWKTEPFVQVEKKTIAPGENVTLSLPKADRRGIRYGTLTIASQENPALVRTESFSIAVMTPATPSQEKPTGFLFGICAHPQRFSLDDQRREAAAAALCGAKVVREDATWGRIQPRAGAWDFSSLDNTVRIFGEQGVEIALIYSYTPQWAIAKEFVPINKDRIRTANSRPDYGYWREFVRRTAAHYRDKIRIFEVWNEPDLFSFSNFTAEEYIEMLKIAGEETHRENPGSMVLTGGYTCMAPARGLNDQQHQEKTLTQARGYFDVHAFHGHGPFLGYRNQIERLVAMRKSLGATEPWWANETALHALYRGEEGQAIALWQKLFYSWANGSIGYNWYDLRNDGTVPDNVEHNYGMIRFDFNPKAVYLAYNTLTRHFGKAEFVKPISAEGLHLYQFRSGNDMLLAGWDETTDSENRLYFCRTDAKEATMLDLYDNRSALPVSGGWTLLQSGSSPYGVQLGEAKLFEVVCEPISVIGAPVVPRGESTLKFQLENPFPASEEFRLAFALPEGVKLKKDIAPLRLRAGEKREVAVELLCDRTLSTGSKIAVQLTVPARKFAGHIAYPIHPVIRLEDSFPAQPDFVLDNVKQLTSLVPADPSKAHLFWQGAKDASADIRLARDGKNLKLKVVVTDDIHYQPFRDDGVWEGDNIQLGLQIPGQNNSWELGLTLLADGNAATWCWGAPKGFDPQKVASAIRLKASRDEAAKKTLYEAEIPLAAIGAGKEPMIRFNLLLNDNDGEMRESYLRLFHGLGSGRTSADWPWLMLKD